MRKEAKDPTVAEVLELRNFNQLLIQWILSYLQRRIGIDVGVEPGAEMKAAIFEAEQRGIPVSLVDRDIRLTLLRFWQSLGIVGKIKMFFALVVSIAEVDNQGLWQSATLGVACVSNGSNYVHGLLTKVVEWIEHNRPDVQVMDYQIEIF